MAAVPASRAHHLQPAALRALATPTQARTEMYQ
eukprot:COSAG04_NODE_10909_length_744_cov_2.506977_1_plen_32_part_10